MLDIVPCGREESGVQDVQDHKKAITCYRRPSTDVDNVSLVVALRLNTQLNCVWKGSR